MNVSLADSAAENARDPGMCVGFAAGKGSHCLVNRSDKPAAYLEVGDHSPNDEVFYPVDDLKVAGSEDGRQRYVHKDGAPY